MFPTFRCFVSRGRRGTLWHSDVFCNVSKVVLCGRHNTFATFSEDAWQFLWQAQHFGGVHRHFVWQAQHFRRVALHVFCKSHWQGCVMATRCKFRGRRGILWHVLKIDGSLARNIDFEVAKLQVPEKTRRKTSILMLQSVKSGGSLVRNARFDAPTCLVSSLWLSRGFAVSMGEAAKPVLLSCCQLWKLPEVSRKMFVLMLPRVSSRVSGFPVASPCLWGKLQNLSFLEVSKQVVMSFCVAGVALCDIPISLITCRKCLWFSRHVAVSIREAAKHLLFEGFQAGCHVVLRGRRGTFWHSNFTLHTLHSTLYSLHSTLHTLHFTVYTLQSTLYTLHSTVHNLHVTHSTLPTPHFTLHTLTPHSTLCTPHSTLYITLLSALCTLNSTLYTPHFTLYTPHLTVYTVHSSLHTLHFSLHTNYSTLHTPHSTLHTLHSTLYTPHFTHSTLTTLHCTLLTLHSTLRTLHFTLLTPHLHSTLYTLHSTLNSLHCTLLTPHFTLLTPHSLLYSPHSTLYTPYFTLHTYTPHSTLYIPHSTL